VTLEEIKKALHAALPVRVPLYDPNAPPRERIEGLEKHILLVAWHRAELEEALHWAIELGKTLRREWDGVEGHEAAAARLAPDQGADRDGEGEDRAGNMGRAPGSPDSSRELEATDRQARRQRLRGSLAGLHPHVGQLSPPGGPV
jgi:hypothetical protein